MTTSMSAPRETVRGATAALEVKGLRKSFGELVAVDGISFAVREGEIFGFLGPNGAGKTTTISMICGLLTPTEGEILVEGRPLREDPRAVKQRLGVVPQEVALYEDLTARENLEYWGGAQGLRGAAFKKRVDEVLDLAGLADRAREPVKRFSGGMRRRLNFACGILHHPKVLLLDEPTVGVDPQSRVRLLDLVREEAREGTCVLYTTHYMEEAETLCDRLAVIDHGRIIAQGTLAELRSMLNERDLLRFAGAFQPGPVRAALERIPGVELLQVDEAQLALAVPEASRRLPEIFAALSGVGAEVRGTTLSQPSLESLFIKLTGKELRE